MKPINNYDDYEANEVVSGGLEKGFYIMRIEKVEDKPEKEYLEIYLDVARGPQTGYFMKLASNNNVWPNQGIWRASYKESATKFFKAFITAIEKSNLNYRWNWEEQSLVGKLCVGVFGEEEYEKDGEIRVGIKLREIRSIEAFQKNDIKMPVIKKLVKKEVVNTPINVDVDSPF